MKFDRAKFEALLLHVCAHCNPARLGAVKLHKVLYFADMLHYAHTGKSISGATYRKRPLGPTCDELLLTLRDLEKAGKISVKTVDYYGYLKKQYEVTAKPETNRLSADELSLVNEVIEFVCDANSAKTISEFSHTRAWELAEFGAVIEYNSAFFIYPPEVSLEAMEWAGAEVKKVAAQRPQKDSLDRPDFGTIRTRVLEAVRH